MSYLLFGSGSYMMASQAYPFWVDDTGLATPEQCAAGSITG